MGKPIEELSDEELEAMVLGIAKGLRAVREKFEAPYAELEALLEEGHLLAEKISLKAGRGEEAAATLEDFVETLGALKQPLEFHEDGGDEEGEV